MKKRRHVVDKRVGNKHVGSSLNEFLAGRRRPEEETRAVAIKEMVVCQIQQAMLKNNIAKMAMARRISASRSAPDRLLDSANDEVTLLTLSRAAHVIGLELLIELV
jgi:antitoxin HicB